MTGRELAYMAEPARELGIMAWATAQETCDTLARLIGEAIPEHEIPQHTRSDLAQGIVLIAIAGASPEDMQAAAPARAWLQEAEGRWMGEGVADQRARLAHRHGQDVADAFLDELRRVGAAIVGALGDTMVPPTARDHLALTFSAVADQRTGARTSRP